MGIGNICITIVEEIEKEKFVETEIVKEIYYRESKIYVKENQSILLALRENNRYLPAICSGRGTCGKCKIKLLEGNLPPSKEDKTFFISEKLSEGYRLSCTAYPKEDIKILLRNQDTEFIIIAHTHTITNTPVISDTLISKKEKTKINAKCYGIGIDIGTTTIAMALFDITNNVVLNRNTTINKQRIFGADVISRIEASNEGRGKELRNSILNDLKQCLEGLLQNKIINIQNIIISGNTTMIHLLMGFPTNTLGVHPFTPYQIGAIHLSVKDLFQGEVLNEFTRVTIFPGISTFVGGDIVSDLFYLGFNKKEKISILIDLGTNGEIAIGNKDQILVASTAAGPAFEGGNITFGTGSIPGAICGVTIDNNKVSVTTILDKTPVGICGTGVIESVYELYQCGFLDETGLLHDTYFDTGYPLYQGKDSNIFIYQKDIREIQLAKAAIRAGIEILLREFEIKAEEVETVYLAGGFGFYLDVKKAVGIGLLPKGFEKKTKVIGNGSLNGTLTYMREKQANERIKQIISVAKEIHLSNDKEFQQLFIDYMYLES